MTNKKLRIIYMGTPEFAVEPLRRLVDEGYNIVAVVTVPDKPSGRGLKVHQSAVKQYALDHNIKLLQPDKLRDPAWLDELRALEPDLAVVVAFRMLPEVVWALPRLGTFNLHSSLLPRYRGAAPINWAVINGDTETGVTTFMLDDKIDCGAIIAQRRTSIAESESAGSLHDRLMIIGGELVLETVDKIADGAVEPLPQNGVATAAPKIFKEDCKIDWQQLTPVIYNKIRGLSPYPAAWFEWNAELTAKIFEAHPLIEPHDVAPGSIETDSRLWLRVATIDGWIYIDSIQLAGKKMLPIQEFLRGYRA